MCIIGSTGGDHISANDYILVGDLDSHSRTLGRTKMMQYPKKIKKSQGERNSNGSLSETCAAETTVSSMHIKSNKRSTKYSDPVESKTMETTETGNSSFCEGSTLEDTSQTDLSATNLNLFNKDQEHDESLRDVLKWLRPLPPLLSPIQFSPATTPDILFGDITDSSDEEMEDSAKTLENIIENYGQDEQAAESRHEKHSAQSWNTCSSSGVNSANNGPQEASERLRNLRNEELVCSDPVTAKSKCLSEKNAKSKDEEKYLKKNSDLMEIETGTEIAVPSTENLREKMVSMTETKDTVLIPELIFINVRGQESTAELMHVQKMATSSPVHVFEESTGFIKNEEKELPTGNTEDDLSQSPKTDNQPHIEEPIFVVDSVAGLLEKSKHGSSNVSRGEGMAEEPFKDIQSISNSGETRSLGEEATEHVTMDEQNKAIERLGIGRNGEPLLEQKMNISNCKFLSEKEHPIEQVKQQVAELPFIYSVEKKIDDCVGSQCIEENYISEERCDKHNESEENKGDKVMNAGISESQLNTTVVADGCKKSLCHVDEAVQTEKECRASFSMPTKKVDDNQVKIADSMTEEFKSVDIKEEEWLQFQQLTDQKNNCKSPEEHPDCERNCMLPAQASVIKNCLLQSKKPIETNTLVFEVDSVTETTLKLGQVEDADTELQCKSKTHSISNDFYTMKTLMEDECVASNGLEHEFSDSLNTKEIRTMQSGTAGGNVFETVCNRSVETNLISGNLQYEMNATSQEMPYWNSKSSSCHQRKYPVEKDKTNDECSVTEEILAKQNKNKDPTQSTQDVPQTNIEGIETVLPVAVTATSQSATEPVDISASNLEIFSKDGQSSDAEANTLSSVPVCITPSSPVREDITHFDHNTAEGWKNKQENSTYSQEKKHNLDCCSPSNNTNKALTPETSNLNSVNTENILLANKSVLSDEARITVPEKLGRPSKNSALEHALDAAKETDEILSSDKSSGGVDTVKIMNSSVCLSSSEQEVCPLRKVSFLRTSPVPLMAKSKMGTIRNSHTGRASNMTLSGGDKHEVASQKDNSSPGHDTDSCDDEAIERTWDNSYSEELLYSNDKASLKPKASVAKEKSEGKVAKESISAVASLLNQEVICNKKSFSRTSSVSNLEIDSDITPDIKCSGASIETSRTQSHFCKRKLNTEQDMTITASTCSANLEQNHLTSHHVDDSNIFHKKECCIKNNGDTCAVKAIPHNLESSNCSSKPQKLVLEKLESLVTFASHTENSTEKVHMPSDSITVSNVSHDIASHEKKKENQHILMAETILASTDTAASTKQYPQTLIQIREEMGPPLPPLLPPLMATPPRPVRPLSPGTSLPCQSSLPSSLEELISPVHKNPVLISPMSDTLKCKSPAILTTPSPCETPVGQRILSSPLQFCATTPKHALPVPGRLPPSAAGVVAPPVPQENSLKILDSRYPKLSARARTLNILKGNIQLSRSSLVNGKNIPQPVHQISGFKAIASTSTAFVKAGTKFKSDPEQTFCSVGVAGKRILSPVVVPKSAKKPKLESKSPVLDLGKEQLSDEVSEADTWCPPDETDLLSSGDAMQSTGDCDSELLLAVEDINDPDNRAVTVALEKSSEGCFDLLPVILSHVFVGNTSRIPVMRDEEKEVVHELGVVNKHLAEPALQAILNKLKKEKMSLSHNCIQSLCRVYVGICRQLGDLERARLFCYSLLKEDFPKSDRLTLFMGSVWTEIFSSEGVVSKAIELVARQRARGDVLKCLKTYLNWEESAPVKIGMMVSSLLLAIKLCPQMEFQFTEEYGEDLKESTWEYVFAIDLLCSHQKWCWTHDNIISKELWPIMDKWMKNRKGSGSVSSPSDLIVATVLRLIGRLGQIGLREGFSSAVENISSVIRVFLQHAKEKEVAWGVQLAAAYALCDLGPSNPSKILEAIHAWEAENTNSLPPAIASAITEVSNLQTQAGRTEVPHQRNRVT
ncbi:little elongation complex subunit 1 isoform X2 [Sceloporus undulatus]|nr:little elongation complex subunit 1 isoform X2 [Sceloporus undulatus]XP_042318485.1 little elongation complex subunit 1 isoform X2 [Sceloporus undulatus]